MSEDLEYQANLSHLKQLLAEKKWRLADDETRALMCRIAGRDEAPHLTPEAVRVFPCGLLRAIDLLWSVSSLGRFGFRIQRELWLECGGSGVVYDFHQMGHSEKQALAKIENQFAAKVGWRDPAGWMGVSEVSASRLLTGHLPYSCLMCSYGHGLIGTVASAIAWRIQACSISNC